MAPFDRLLSSCYCRSIVTMALSCVISEIKQNRGRKSRFFLPTCIRCSLYRGPRRNIAITIGRNITRMVAYQIVKKSFDNIFYSFRHNTRTWRTSIQPANQGNKRGKKRSHKCNTTAVQLQRNCNTLQQSFIIVVRTILPPLLTGLQLWQMLDDCRLLQASRRNSDLGYSLWPNYKTCTWYLYLYLRCT